MHTPGPWYIDLETPFTLGGDSRSVEALTPDGKMVTREIANLMFDTDEWPDGEGWIEDAGNARLIAAAPELLAACEAAMYLVTRYGSDDLGSTLSKAIAAAKGTTPDA